MLSFGTRDGGTVEITRHETFADVHVKAPDGRSVATVHMTNPEAAALVLGHKRRK
jgi:hypothetical protein